MLRTLERERGRGTNRKKIKRERERKDNKKAIRHRIWEKTKKNTVNQNENMLYNIIITS